jgi:acetoin utilization protein AcuB
MIARDLMTKDPMTLTEQATVADAAELMHERDIRHVPIVDREGALVGIVSDRDLGSLDLGRLIGDAGVEGLRAHLARPVVKVMTPEVVTVGPEDGLDELVDLMLESRVGAVPVVERHSRRVVGIVSYVDVLRAFRNAQG